MTRYATLAAAGAALACLGAGAAWSQETGGVRISGTVNKTTVVGSSVNVASGIASRAHTSIGSIGSGVTVQGNLNMNVIAQDVVNMADGVADEAITSIGSVHQGANVSGSREVTVSTGRVVNMGDGCLIIGSLGDVPGC